VEQELAELVLGELALVEPVLRERVVPELEPAELAAPGRKVPRRQASRMLTLIPQELALVLKLRARPERQVSELERAAGKTPAWKQKARREFVSALVQLARVRAPKKVMKRPET
jgi:hypothetical protein